MKQKIVILLALFFAMIAPIRAQETGVPIIYNMNGDLWAWNEGDAAPRQLTHEGHIYVPFVSPDGKYIAYEALSDSEINGEGHDGLQHTDVWVMDIASGETKMVSTDQPRSPPAWSPDSTKLVWAEHGERGKFGDTSEASVYDLQTGATRVAIKNLPVECFDDTQPYVGWSETGFVVDSRACGAGYPVAFLFYDRDGKLIASVISSDTEFGDAWEMASYNGKETLAVPHDQQWLLFDPLTGQFIGAFDSLQAYGLAHPDEVVSVTTTPDNSYPTFALRTETRSSIDLGYSPDNFAFSSDGGAVAYPWQSNVRIERKEQVEQIPIGADDKIGTFAWGAVGWRVAPGAVPSDQPLPDGLVCPGALPPTLYVSGQGDVVPGTGANNLRTEASEDGVKVGAIPEGGVFTVKEGPTCAEGMLWWKVQYKDQIAWTAEGKDGVYFLEPEG